MRNLSEVERDEIEAVAHYIRYVTTKPNVETFEIWDAIMRLNQIGQKYVTSEICSEEELNELVNLDEMKELITKFFLRLEKHYMAEE